MTAHSCDSQADSAGSIPVTRSKTKAQAGDALPNLGLDHLWAPISAAQVARNYVMGARVPAQHALDGRGGRLVAVGANHCGDLVVSPDRWPVRGVLRRSCSIASAFGAGQGRAQSLPGGRRAGDQGLTCDARLY
jgi:hypothetical protein